jgi:hypothetical protein
MKTKTAIVLVLTALSLSACVKKQELVSTGTGVAPSLVVEQFLKASNSKDIETMGKLFGTKEGPYWSRFPHKEVEQRMFAIATELRHSDYKVDSEQMVPGRTNEATRLMVRLTKDDRQYMVPFTMVRYKSQSWLVEQIGIEVLTKPRS